MKEIYAIKDETASHPIASSWRPLLEKVVNSFSKGDYELNCSIEGVEPVAPDIAEHNRKYVAEYGEVLVELPEKTWESSCAQWMETHWDVLIDLYTQNEGLSDLVLTGKMLEINGKPYFTVGLIYVP